MLEDYVNAHFAKHPVRVRPRIVCADGWSLSVQAGPGLYSNPKEDADHYSLVEVGYPERADGSAYYPRQFGEWSGGVCGWVSVTTVNRWIKYHGGIKRED